jgi:hypothetical protein
MLLPSTRFLPRLLTLLAAAVLPVAAVGQTVTASLTTKSGEMIYSPNGGQLTLAFTTTYTSSLTGYGLEVQLPTSWTYLSQTVPSGLGVTTPPSVGDNFLEWGFQAFPANSFTLEFTVSYPAGLTGTQVIDPVAYYRPGPINVDVAPISLTSASAIPEPSTYAAIAGAGALALAFWRRRQNRRSAAQETERAGSA